MKKVLIVALSVTLSMALMVGVVGVRPVVGKTLWTATGSCQLEPVSVSNDASTAACTLSPTNTVALAIASVAVDNVAENEYVRTNGCGPKTPRRTSSCPPDFDGPWKVDVDTSATSIMIQMTGLPNEGKWDATYSGPDVRFIETQPIPGGKTLAQSDAAFIQWESDLEGVFGLAGWGGIGADPNDYLITTSGDGHLTTVIVSRPT